MHNETICPVLASPTVSAETLARSLELKHFTSAFQPVVRPDGTVLYAEALARLRCEGSLVSAGSFLPLARTMGLELEIDRQVIEQSLTMAKRAPVGINLTSAALADDQIFAWLRQAPRAPGCVLELVESEEHLLDGPLRRRLEALREQGWRVAIDDFGTGHSVALQGAFKADFIKFDKSFLSWLGCGLDVPLTEIAKALGQHSQLIAEGIEEEAQSRWAASAGMSGQQGWLHAPALSAQTLLAWPAKQLALA